MSKPEKQTATAKDRAEFKSKHGKRGVSLARDNNGVYVYTHRWRSESYPSAGKIPAKEVDFTESTG